jgi:hypothetical protein
MPTAEWGTYVASCPEDERRIIHAIHGYIGADGGFPVRHHGLVLGGIGVSGATQALDADVARAALAASVQARILAWSWFGPDAGGYAIIPTPHNEEKWSVSASAAPSGIPAQACTLRLVGRPWSGTDQPRMRSTGG